MFVVLFVGLFVVVTAFVFVVCWVVVSFAPHGKKIKPRRAFDYFINLGTFDVVQYIASLSSQPVALL